MKLRDLPTLAKYPVLQAIRVYQKTLSFDHGPLRKLYPEGFCRFHPSCSEYGYKAIERHGLLKGGVKTLWRILRCNPWSQGGVDQP